MSNLGREFPVCHVALLDQCLCERAPRSLDFCHNIYYVVIISYLWSLLHFLFNSFVSICHYLHFCVKKIAILFSKKQVKQMFLIRHYVRWHFGSFCLGSGRITRYCVVSPCIVIQHQLSHVSYKPSIELLLLYHYYS